MSTPSRARLNHGLRDVQNVCALTKVGTVLKTTNPENFSSIGQIVLKISFLKGKNTGNLFGEKKLNELTVAEMVLTIRLKYYKI